jgi:hypothetical protein
MVKRNGFYFPLHVFIYFLKKHEMKMKRRKGETKMKKRKGEMKMKKKLK